MTEPNKSQPYPKFSVGEDVLIYSTMFPEINGFKTTVCQRVYGKGTLADAARTPIIGWGYRVDPDPGMTKTKGGGWLEESLRKRPGDFDFKELMESLKRSKPLSKPWLKEPKTMEEI